MRALVATGEQAQAIDRPRFIGLTEFGPGNTLYHEGRKYRIAAVVVPAGGVDRVSLVQSCVTAAATCTLVTRPTLIFAFTVEHDLMGQHPSFHSHYSSSRQYERSVGLASLQKKGNGFEKVT